MAMLRLQRWIKRTKNAPTGCRPLTSRLMQLWRHEGGIAAIEAAFVLPIMIFFIFASIETYQYFRVLGIMNRAAFSVADAVAMQPRLYEGGPCDVTDHLCTYGDVMSDLMLPLNYTDDGHMAIGVYVTETIDGETSWLSTPAWSKDCSPTGTCTDTSELDTLPSGMPAPKHGDSVLVVKVFMKYQPFVISARFWTGLGGTENLSTLAYTRTRFDDLRTLH